MAKEINRRDFLKTGATAALGFTVAPSTILGKVHGHTSASTDKLNILAVGVGGRGGKILEGLESENIIGICDIDYAYAKHVFDRYPKAKRFNDYRVMYDKMLKDADAVMIATADHTHAIIAADAITAGKHVFVEKPLTHSIYESRLLTKLADKYEIASQMGNQGASLEGVRKICEWIWNGEIGEVTKVEAFTNRPIWPQGLNRPAEAMEVPETLNWDAFIGPAAFRPYHRSYTPWNWRGWWDFGTGALGDMGCHILHPVFKALNLKYPSSVQGTSTMMMSDSAPSAEVIRYTFPARDNMPKVAMPEVEVFWYDGGLKPPRPKGLPDGVPFSDAVPRGGGVIFHGTKDTLICGAYGAKPYLLSGRTPNAPKVLREITCSHEMDWVRACKEDKRYRVKPTSDFSDAGPFNEMIVLGANSVRFQDLNLELKWDGENMRFTNIPADANVKAIIQDGFSVKDGHPTFNKKYTEPVNARQFAAELIKHTYREGWSLPEMPK